MNRPRSDQLFELGVMASLITTLAMTLTWLAIPSADRAPVLAPVAVWIVLAAAATLAFQARRPRRPSGRNVPPATQALFSVTMAELNNDQRASRVAYLRAWNDRRQVRATALTAAFTTLLVLCIGSTVALWTM